MANEESLRASLSQIKRALAEHELLLGATDSGSGDEPPEASGEYWHRRKVHVLLCEVIRELEDTRRAFKSRQLENLRKKLLHIVSSN